MNQTKCCFTVVTSECFEKNIEFLPLILLTYKSCRELWYLHPDHGLHPVSDAAGEAQEEVLAAELGAGQDDGVRAPAVDEVHHLPRLLLGPDLLLRQQLRLELVGEADIGQGEDHLHSEVESQ